MRFITDDFLLQNEPARKLYHEYAREEPIFDYHCHLPPADVARNRRFANLFEIWLEGDHYKWRAMRSNGVEERLCTGSGEPYEKFLAYARTVPQCLRNPLYHWSHLELARYFGIERTINAENAEAIWKEAQERLDEPGFSAHGILEKFKVRLIGTTDDPTDTLEHHAAIRRLGIPTVVAPTFRPDKGLRVDLPEAFNGWCDRLAEVSGKPVGTWPEFLAALRDRHDFFHAMGGRASDHGLETCPFRPAAEAEVAGIFAAARRGVAAGMAEQEAFATRVMQEVGRWNAEKGWAMQLHLGAMRNNNTRLFRQLGPDIGFDSIGDFAQGRSLSRFLASLDETTELPKVVLYNLNPADNYLFATMIGNFQDGSVAGKIQFGSGWWFLDQKEAMEWQINALSNNGLLSRFVGMLTDSRSFLSYCRHEYFRRILCNLIGGDVARGELPADYELVGGMVRNICYTNARDYFSIPGVE